MNSLALRSVFAVLTIALVAALTTRPAVSEDVPHLRLVSSAPAADSTVASPSEVRLTFSEAPQEGATRLRLLDAAEELVEVGALTAGDEGTVFRAPVAATLADGAYSIAWRTMAADGHVVSGDVAFRVKGGAVER